MIVVSYYTDFYGVSAQKLKESLSKFDLRFDIEHVDDMGSWKLNNRLKPGFINLMMDSHPKDTIVWVDADAVVLSHPKLFDSVGWDVAAWYNKVNSPWAGTLAFKPNNAARAALGRWMSLIERVDPEADVGERGVLHQDVLGEAFRKQDVRILQLPPSYSWVERLMRRRFPGADPVIEHFMVSRPELGPRR